MIRFLRGLSSGEDVQGLRPTYTDLLFARKAGAVGLGLLFVLVGALMLADENWFGVVAGALIAWGVAIIVWGLSVYRRRRVELAERLRARAEYQALHGRLNQIASRVGARTIDITEDLDKAISFRVARLAHLSGLDEYGTHEFDEVPLWDNEAMGGS